eukprot:SAG31_NODE_2396_length_5784_cov_15.942656_7_plen_138_part_01
MERRLHHVARALQVRRPRSCTAVALRSFRGFSCAGGSIADRGRRAPGLLPAYLADARAVPSYDAVSQPNGCLNLSVAENQMLVDLLGPKLAAASLAANSPSGTEATAPQGRQPHDHPPPTPPPPPPRPSPPARRPVAP